MDLEPINLKRLSFGLYEIKALNEDKKLGYKITINNLSYFEIKKQNSPRHRNYKICHLFLLGKMHKYPSNYVKNSKDIFILYYGPITPLNLFYK